jgi:hypothetical protein
VPPREPCLSGEAGGVEVCGPAVHRVTDLAPPGRCPGGGGGGPARGPAGRGFPVGGASPGAVPLDGEITAAEDAPLRIHGKRFRRLDPKWDRGGPGWARGGSGGGSGGARAYRGLVYWWLAI